jgi:hypothetical protein
LILLLISFAIELQLLASFVVKSSTNKLSSSFFQAFFRLFRDESKVFLNGRQTGLKFSLLKDTEQGTIHTSSVIG